MRLCEAERCTACQACSQVCPVDAISFCLQKNGQLIPRIDERKCVQCGLCRRSCPSLHPLRLQGVRTVYAAWSRHKQDVQLSSSGGVASVLARGVLERQGVVYGAAFQEGAVKHISITDVTQLDDLRGSKYVYSNPQQCYREVKRRLEQGQPVLFISTPCQIAGLKRYLNRDDDRLTTVDLICHGTPPFAYLKEHLDRVAGEGGWETASFRGNSDFELTARKNGVSVYREPTAYDLYFKAYLGNLIFNEACYTCPYAEKERTGDITVGDFWGLDRQTLLHEYQGKISLVLVNSQRGETLFDSCRNELICEERSLAEAVAGQDNLKGASPRPGERDLFLANYPQHGFDAAVGKTSLGKAVKRLRLKRRVVFMPVVSQLLAIRRWMKNR